MRYATSLALAFAVLAPATASSAGFFGGAPAVHPVMTAQRAARPLPATRALPVRTAVPEKKYPRDFYSHVVRCANPPTQWRTASCLYDFPGFWGVDLSTL